VSIAGPLHTDPAAFSYEARNLSKKWYRRAADQGNAEAQMDLGKAYYYGHGVTLNHKEAVKWYRLAADQGNADGQMLLAFMYSKGEGVAKDYREAINWYRLSADQGNADAQFFLANPGGRRLRPSRSLLQSRASRECDASAMYPPRMSMH
jgi:TPR repeat protein